MAKTATVKLRIDEEKRNRVREIAAHEDRSMSYIIEKAIDDRIAYEEKWATGIAEARVEIKAGRGVPHADVAAWVQSLGTSKPLPRPTSSK